MFKVSLSMKSFIDKLFTAICNAKQVALFVHEDPDFDTMGSAYGLKRVIEENFPNKPVHVMGTQLIYDRGLDMGIMPVLEDAKVDCESFVKDAIGISLDTANEPRVWKGEYFKKCLRTFRIDHHLFIKQFADEEYIDSTVSSCAQVTANICFAANMKINSDAATYFYAGMLTDTNRFYFDTVNALTYNIAAMLYECGARRQEVHKAVYNRSINQIAFTNYLFSLAQFDRHIAYLLAPKDCHVKYGIKYLTNVSYVLVNIEGYPFTVCAHWSDDKQCYKVSLRSSDMPVIDIARHFNGGGHKMAAGCSVKTEQEFYDVVEYVKNQYEKYLEEQNAISEDK